VHPWNFVTAKETKKNYSLSSADSCPLVREQLPAFRVPGARGGVRVAWLTVALRDESPGHCLLPAAVVLAFCSTRTFPLGGINGKMGAKALEITSVASYKVSQLKHTRQLMVLQSETQQCVCVYMYIHWV